MYSPQRFSQRARELSQAIYALSRENNMGMADLKEQLWHIPNIDKLQMKYGDGGKTEVYTMGDIDVELPAGSNATEIAAALANPFEHKKKLKQ